MASSIVKGNAVIQKENPPKAVVVGSGPAGLFSSILLSNRGFSVDLIERHPDILVAESGAFALNYSFDKKPLRAISHAGLDIPDDIVAPSEGITIHSQDGLIKPKFISYQTGVRLLCVSRDKFVSWLLKESKRDNIKHLSGWTFHSFLANGNIARFIKTKSKESKVHNESESEYMDINDYSLFVGADGVHSKVRNGIVELDLLNGSPDHKRFTFEQIKNTHMYKTLPIISPSTLLKALRIENPFSIQIFKSTSTKTLIMCSPLPEGGYSGVLFSTNDKIFTLESLKTSSDAKEFLKKNYPQLYSLFNEMGEIAFESISNAPIARAGTSTYCSRLNNGKIVLIGDAAHSMYPSLGQGCNSALVDSFLLDQVFMKYESAESIDVESSLVEFNERRLEEVKTIVSLSENPPYPGSGKDLFSNIRVLARILILTYAKKIWPYIKGPRPLANFEDVSYLEVKKRINEDEREALGVLLASVPLIYFMFYIPYAFIGP